MRLKEAIQNNVVVSVEVVQRHESMNNLDISARWELLAHNPVLIPEPNNEDTSFRPPTERDAPVNPKYRYDEVFELGKERRLQVSSLDFVTQIQL